MIDWRAVEWGEEGVLDPETDAATDGRGLEGVSGLLHVSLLVLPVPFQDFPAGFAEIFGQFWKKDGRGAKNNEIFSEYNIFVLIWHFWIRQKEELAENIVNVWEKYNGKKMLTPFLPCLGRLLLLFVIKVNSVDIVLYFKVCFWTTEFPVLVFPVKSMRRIICVRYPSDEKRGGSGVKRICFARHFLSKLSFRNLVTTNLSTYLQGLPRNILDEGPFLDTPDWSFADGRPGVPRYVSLAVWFIS